MLLELSRDGGERALEPGVQVLPSGLEGGSRFGHEAVVEALHKKVFLGHHVYRVAAEPLGGRLESLHGQDVLFQVKRWWRQIGETIPLLEFLVDLIDEVAR